MLDASSPAETPVEADSTEAKAASRATDVHDPASLKRRLKWPAVSAFVLQFVLILGDRIPSVDSMSYFETGRNFVNGNGYTRNGAPEMHFPPVAPIGLGILEKLTGNEMFALRTWELAWGLGAVALLVGIAWYLSRNDDVVVATAWIATLVCGVIPLAVLGGSGSELPTTMLILGSALLVLIALDPKTDHSPLRQTFSLIAAGTLVGIAYLTRPEALMPGATIGLAALIFTLRDRRHTLLKRLGLATRYGAAFGFAALLFVAPYLVYTHSNSGSWSMKPKNKDASIDAWRAVAQNDRLERDRILYSIQPDGVSLGPETRSLAAIAREHPRNWLTIAWINTTTVISDYVGHPLTEGPTWKVIPLYLSIPALWQLWRTRRRDSTQLFAALAAWPLVTCFFFFAQPRYLMLTTAVLIPFGVWGLVDWTGRLRLGRQRMVWWAVGILSVLSFAVVNYPLLPFSTAPERTEQRTAGQWIAEHTPPDARIMTRSFHVQGYGKRDVVAMPSAEYRSMLEFARRMGVSYIVADGNTIKRRRPEVFDILMRENGAPAGLELVHQFTESGRLVKIYRLDPAPPPSTQPPLWLGYVSD